MFERLVSDETPLVSAVRVETVRPAEILSTHRPHNMHPSTTHQITEIYISLSHLSRIHRPNPQSSRDVINVFYSGHVFYVF